MRIHVKVRRKQHHKNDESQVSPDENLASIIFNGNHVTAQGPFIVYPNPANSVLHIAGAYITSVTINDLYGQVVYRHECKSSEIHIDITDLPAGVYFVKINGSEVRKFLKE
jgi:hypothetical protein